MKCWKMTDCLSLSFIFEMALKHLCGVERFLLVIDTKSGCLRFLQFLVHHKTENHRDPKIPIFETVSGLPLRSNSEQKARETIPSNLRTPDRATSLFNIRTRNFLNNSTYPHISSHARQRIRAQNKLRRNAPPRDNTFLLRYINNPTYSLLPADCHYRCL